MEERLSDKDVDVLMSSIRTGTPLAEARRQEFVINTKALLAHERTGIANVADSKRNLAQVKEFQNYLIQKKYSVFIRKNRGTDILGACGQLAAQTLTSVTP